MTITRPNAGEYSARANTARTGRRTKVAFRGVLRTRARTRRSSGRDAGGALRARIQFCGNHRGATWRERGLFALARMQFCRPRSLRPAQGHAWGPIPTPLLARNLRPAQGNAFRRRRGGSEGAPAEAWRTKSAAPAFSAARGGRANRPRAAQASFLQSQRAPRKNTVARWDIVRVVEQVSGAPPRQDAAMYPIRRKAQGAGIEVPQTSIPAPFHFRRRVSGKRRTPYGDSSCRALAQRLLYAR